MEVSKEVREKAFRLLRENKVKKDIETDKRIHFTVQGETEEHSVIYDKVKKEWNCDCIYLTLKEKMCSHILAAKLFLEQKESKYCKAESKQISK
jgi:hypothetical protein